MGQVQSVDPRHVGIYKKLLAIQNPTTRLQMIDTVLSDPTIVHSAKVTGVYAQLLQVAAAIRHGGVAPYLPGEAISTPTPSQKVKTNQPNNLQYHPQAFQMPVKQTQQIVPAVTSHRDSDPYSQMAKPKRSEKALHFFSACLRVLNIQEEVALTESMLKSAYKKASLRSHPDKQGGSKEAFDAVTRAYAYLMDILQLVKGRQTKGESGTVPELESVKTQRSSASSEWQMPTEPVKLNPKNLNMTVFNQLFEQTRLPDPDEDGYGDWLKDPSEQRGGPRKGSKKFSEDFNREVFNRMFEEEQGHTELIRFQQPQELMMSPSYGVELGRDRPADYTAAPNSDLQFTDLRAAYTKENTVSNQVQNIRVEQRDFQNYKASRERAPDVYNQSELASLAAYESQQKAREDARRIRAAQEQLGAREYFERMKQLVITEK